MDRFRMRGEGRACGGSACKASRTRRRDGLTTRGWCHHRRGGGGCWKVLELPFIQHVLTASTVMYDQAEHCPIRLRAWIDSQAIGGWP